MQGDNQAPVFIGDELTAAGYRLAGARTYVPGEGELIDVFERASGEAEVVLITAELAARLPPSGCARRRSRSCRS